MARDQYSGHNAWEAARKHGVGHGEDAEEVRDHVDAQADAGPRDGRANDDPAHLGAVRGVEGAPEQLQSATGGHIVQ